jgi:hypothetical protein
MLYREIIAVCSQIHTKHINILSGQNVELLSVKPGGTYSYHWAMKSLYQLTEQNRTEQNGTEQNLTEQKMSRAR